MILTDSHHSIYFLNMKSNNNVNTENVCMYVHTDILNPGLLQYEILFFIIYL